MYDRAPHYFKLRDATRILRRVDMNQATSIEIENFLFDILPILEEAIIRAFGIPRELQDAIAFAFKIGHAIVHLIEVVVEWIKEEFGTVWKWLREEIGVIFGF